MNKPFIILFLFFASMMSAQDLSRSQTYIITTLTNTDGSITTNRFRFFDPFTPLMVFESPDALHLSIAEYFYPVNELLFPNLEARWHKKWRYKRKLELLTVEELTRYRDLSFEAYSVQRQTRRLNFTPVEQQHLNIGFEQWETKIIVSGSVNLRTGYGISFRDETFPQLMPGIYQGFNINQNMRVNIVGKIGDRVQVSINHSSDNPDNEYEIAYNALSTDSGFLKELRAGNISLNIPQSSYFVRYNGTSKDSYGLKSSMQFGDLTWQIVLNLTKSKKGYKKYTGTRQLVKLEVQDVSYTKRRYFVLPDAQIDTSSLEVLYSVAQQNLSDKTIDSHYFKKLVSGRDFYVNNLTGELTLTNTQDRNSDLVVRYTSGGAPFTILSNAVIATENATGEKYLYIWQATNSSSPFIHNGYYQLPYRNFDPTRGFSLTVVSTVDKTSVSSFQFSPSDYEISPVTGTLKFRVKAPFPDLYGKIYLNSSDPSPLDSLYTMLISFYNDVKTYQLDFNIIPGTERVYLNGRQLAASDYTLVSSIGELIFNNPSLINENDTIEIYYEYKPFWSGSQKFGIASRLDWKPSKILNLGSTLIYNISQREPGAPSIYSTPDSTFLADIDGAFNMARFFNMPEDLELSVKGEYALSVYNPNTADYAIIDDFENAGDTFSFTKNENRWILCAPTTNIDGLHYTNRGLLLYKDFRNYNLDGTYSLLNYGTALSADKIKDYSFKPGPYTTLGGHLNTALYPNVSQSAIVFDYDFRNSGTWVGAAFSIGGPAGINLSEYNEITFWANIQGDDDGDNNFSDSHSDSVELYTAIGQINEDGDGNSVMEFKIDKAQAGYDFHNYSNPALVETHIGIGRLGGGDGYLQTEDLNGNGVLDTNENMVLFPGPGGYTDVTNALLTGGGWKKYTINIRSLNQNQLSILSHASVMAFYIKNRSGSKGRVIVDSFDFKKISWRDRVVDGVPSKDTTVMEAENISVFNSTFYASHRFYLMNTTDTKEQDRATVFEKLHGPKSVSEASQLNEKSLALNYHLTNVLINTNSYPVYGGTSAFLLKKNTAGFDISKYKNLNFYLFVPDTDENGLPLKVYGDTYTNEYFSFILGTSESSYYRWRVPLDKIQKNTWMKANISILENLTLDIDSNKIIGFDKPATVGRPNLQDINYLQIGVETSDTNELINNGTVWINELYAAGGASQVGMAFMVNPVLEYKKPLWKIGELEIIGPIALRTFYENRDVNFIPAEGTKNGSFNNNINISLASSFLKDLHYTVAYDENNQGTTTNLLDLPFYLQWNGTKKTFNDSVSYTGKDYLPSISHSFTESFEYRLTRNLMSSITDDVVLNSLYDQYTSSAKVAVNKAIPFFKGLTVTPGISFEDLFYLLDQSGFTNDSVLMITNSGVYGMKGSRKTLTTGMTVNLFSFTIQGDYAQTAEKYNKIQSILGYRSALNELRAESLFIRYGERLRGIFEGFYFPDILYDKQNGDSMNFAFGADRPIQEFPFVLSINDKLARDANSFTYDSSQNLITRFERYSMANETRLTVYPRFLLLDTIQFRNKRDLELNYQSVSNILFYTNILESYSEIYYYQPFYYNAYFTGAYGRTNSLSIMEKYSDGSFNSYTRIADLFSMDIILLDFRNILDSVIPKRYNFSTTLNTSRSLSSYVQSLDNQFSTSLNMRIVDWNLPFLKQTESFRVGDMVIGFNYRDLVTYNDRKIADTIGGSLGQTVWLQTNMNLIFSYSLSYTAENFLRGFETFENYYGFSSDTNLFSPIQKYSHVGNIVLNWVLGNISELNFVFFKINLAGSAVNNKESLTVSADSLTLNGTKFLTMTQKVFEITYDHDSQYQFTDYIIGSLLMRGVLNQYADLTPVGTEIRTTYYKPGFGMQIAFDLRIKF